MLERAASLAGAAGGGEPHFSTDDLERSGDIRAAFSWTGWRLRLLVLAALLASLAVATTARLLAVSPLLLAEWQVTAQQQLMLHDSPERELHPYFGRTLTAMSGADGQRFEVDALALQRSPRWQVDDERRRRQITMQQRMAAAFAAGRVNLHFSDGDSVEVDTQRRGIGGLGLLFVPLSTLALALMLLGSVVVLARPQLRNGLYFVMALCQGIGLLFVAVGSARCLGMPTALLEHDMLLRMALDGVTAAAAVHAFAVHPRRLPQARLIAVAAWTSAAAVLLLAGAGALASLWWWAQGLALGLGAASLAVVSVSYRAEPNPFAAVMRRIGAAALATLALATLAVAAAASEPGAGPQATASIAAT
ncbi:MAG: histidine kinase, partial [Rubrivivax sp.]|nr:histidine kinase [Rubrivivax sp.]